MAEYIDRVRAQQAVNLAADKDDAFRRVSSLPAADVVPVRHGRWIPVKPYNNTYMGFKCSECGAQFQGLHRDNYCGNCGVRMEVKNDV